MTHGLMKSEVCTLTFKIGIAINSSQIIIIIDKNHLLPLATFAPFHSASQERVNEKLMSVATVAESQASDDKLKLC